MRNEGVTSPRRMARKISNFVVFRFGLTFLLSIGQGNHVVAMVSIIPVNRQA
jgi:hypothetical protein